MATAGNEVIGNRIGTSVDGTSGSAASAWRRDLRRRLGQPGWWQRSGRGQPDRLQRVWGRDPYGIDQQRHPVQLDPDNLGLGIDLLSSGSGVTPNDPGDADPGANQLQNFPVLASATTDGSTTTVTRSLNSTPDTTFQLQFFANTACDDSGYGEGERLLGSDTVITDGFGDVAFEFSAAVATSLGEAITATATDAAGNTSEFSACADVTEPVYPTYDLDVSLAGDGSGSVSSNPAGIDCGSRPAPRPMPPAPRSA